MRRLTPAEFIRRAKQKHGNLYSYDKTIYSRMTEKVTITCPFHGDFEQVAGKHIEGHGCRKCRKPRGERDVDVYLRRHNITYEAEVCLDQKHRYDFCVEVDGMKGLIEYHGVQHYRPVAFGGSTADYSGILERDEIKAAYARKEGIPLLIIPHNDYDRISDLVARFLDGIGKKLVNNVSDATS